MRESEPKPPSGGGKQPEASEPTIHSESGQLADAKKLNADQRPENRSFLIRKRSLTMPVRRSPSLNEHHHENIRWPEFGGSDDDDDNEDDDDEARPGTGYDRTPRQEHAAHAAESYADADEASKEAEHRLEMLRAEIQENRNKSRPSSAIGNPSTGGDEEHAESCAGAEHSTQGRQPAAAGAENVAPVVQTGNPTLSTPAACEHEAHRSSPGSTNPPCHGPGLDGVQRDPAARKSAVPPRRPLPRHARPRVHWVPTPNPGAYTHKGHSVATAEGLAEAVDGLAVSDDRREGDVNARGD